MYNYLSNNYLRNTTPGMNNSKPSLYTPEEAYNKGNLFADLYEEYKNYPLITKQRMFLETMEDVLPELKVVIDNGNGDILKYYPISDLAGAAVNESSTEQ